MKVCFAKNRCDALRGGLIAGSGLTQLLKEREVAFDERFRKTFGSFPGTPQGASFPHFAQSSCSPHACQERLDLFALMLENPALSFVQVSRMLCPVSRC